MYATDEDIIRLYKSFERGIINNNRIKDKFMRDTAIIATSGLFNSFKIWFQRDLERLGLDVTLCLRIPPINSEPQHNRQFNS